SPRYFAFHGQASVECGQGVVSEGNEKRYRWRNSSNGKRLRRSLGPRWSVHVANVPLISTKCAPRIRHCERKSTLCSPHTRMLTDYQTLTGQSPLCQHNRSRRCDLYPACCCPTDTASSRQSDRVGWASCTAPRICG